MTGDIEAILETGGAAAIEIAASALAERGTKTGDCANCGNPLVGPYCAMCGQPHNVHRGSIGHLLRDLFEDILSFDSRILRTARALVLQPGELPLAFHEGRTQRYVPAVRLYLFVSLLFFLFLSVTGIALMQFTMTLQTQSFVADAQGNVFVIKDGKREAMSQFKADAKGNVYVQGDDDKRVADVGFKADGSVNNNVATVPVFFRPIGDARLHIPPKIKAQLDKIEAEGAKDVKASGAGWVQKYIYGTLQKLETDPAALNGPLTTWIPRILFLLVPLYALLLVAFYWRKRKAFYFVDHLVFSLTMHSFAFVVLIAAAVAAQVIPGNWVAMLTALALGSYLFLSIRNFYRQGWIATSLKFVALAVIYFFFLLLPALGVALAAGIVVG